MRTIPECRQAECIWGFIVLCLIRTLCSTPKFGVRLVRHKKCCTGYTRIRTDEYNKAQVPALTRRFFARSTSSGNQFWASPMRIAVESAIHLWPAAPKAAPTNWLSVFSLLASGITTPWFFAPWWTEDEILKKQLYSFIKIQTPGLAQFETGKYKWRENAKNTVYHLE